MRQIMFKNRVYFPILKSKQGELRALRHLTEDIREHLVPTIDVIPNANAKKQLGEHLNNICHSVAQYWGTKSPVFFDLFDLNPGQRTEINEHPVDHLFRSARNCSLNAIPTCGLDRDSDYVEAINRVLQEMEPYILVRLQREDLQAPTIAVPKLQAMLSYLDLSPEQVAILMDFREVQEPIPRLSKQAQALISYLAKIGNWNRLIIAGSAMPKSIASVVGQSSQGFIARLEEDLWSDINSNLELAVAFGDYTVVNPEYVDLDPRIFANTMGPSIRYTTVNSWLIARGSSFRNHPDGYRQYYSLASEIESSSVFLGEDYSFGDQYISDRAGQLNGTGNPSTWITAGSNHHMTFVVNQLLAG